jgi:hypothetical protein
MKFFNSLLASLSIVSLAACGSLDQNANLTDELNEASSAELAAQLAAEEELSSLGFNHDACKISMSQVTYTHQQGGSIDIGYEFFKLTQGDRVRISELSSKAVVWDSGVLPEASGSLSVAVASLKPGQYRVQGFINTKKTDQQADCGPRKRVVIRVR